MARMERRAGLPAQCAPCRNVSNGWKLRRLAPTPLGPDTKLDGDFEIQDTIPEVRVPRHETAGDLVYDSKTSGIRGPRPKGVAERVVQFSPVRGRQRLTDEILQCGCVEDKINIFEKIGEGDGDRAASSVRCRSRSQT